MALCQFSESFRIYFDKSDSGFHAVKTSMKFEHRRHLYIFEQIRNAALIETNDNPMEPSLVNMACEKKKSISVLLCIDKQCLDKCCRRAV